MEMFHVGEQCSHGTCRQLDYLPFKCDGCRRAFCSSHFKAERHACPSPPREELRAATCPLCNNVVSVGPGGDLPREMDAHIRRKCAPTPQQQQMASKPCSVHGCRRREFTPFVCKDCGLNHCLKHRVPEDHSCNPSAAVRARRLQHWQRLVAAH